MDTNKIAAQITKITATAMSATSTVSHGGSRDIQSGRATLDAAGMGREAGVTIGRGFTAGAGVAGPGDRVTDGGGVG